MKMMMGQSVTIFAPGFLRYFFLSFIEPVLSLLLWHLKSDLYFLSLYGPLAEFPLQHRSDKFRLSERASARLFLILLLLSLDMDQCSLVGREISLWDSGSDGFILLRGAIRALQEREKTGSNLGSLLGDQLRGIKATIFLNFGNVAVYVTNSTTNPKQML